MDITSLSSLVGVQQQQNIQKSGNKLSSAIAAIASGKRLTSSSTDTASLSVASQLQSAVSGLKKASGNIAQVSSLAQVADGGVEQIEKIVQELRNLAQQAGSPTLNDDNRRALNEQFKQLAEQVDSIVSGTTFNDKKLLDGSLSGSEAISLDTLLSSEGDEAGRLSINDLSSSSLFKNNTLDISTPENATNILPDIESALNDIISTRVSIGSFLQSANFAAANVDSAVANQEAARSTLEDTDFAEAATQQSQATLQQNAAIAVAAQGNRLTPALLKLVG